MKKEVKNEDAKVISTKKGKAVEKVVAKKDVVKIYKAIVLWASLVIAVFLLVEMLVITGKTTGGESSLFALSNLLSSAAFYIFYALLIYSVIMLIYVLAKKRNDAYLFSILVPVFFVLSYPAEMVVSSMGPYGANMPPNGWGYFLVMAVLFFYALYDRWKN